MYAGRNSFKRWRRKYGHEKTGVPASHARLFFYTATDDHFEQRDYLLTSCFASSFLTIPSR